LRSRSGNSEGSRGNSAPLGLRPPSVETYVTEESFTAKVIDRGGRKGRYFWAPSREVAVAEFGAEPCRHRADPV
jgi:hypothetical protein